MNTNMNVTIRRLANTFILAFLLVSGVAAYIQTSNRAFYNGPTLAGNTTYEPLGTPRTCPPIDSALRGRIFDRHGNIIAQTVADGPNDHYPCGYHRVYASWVASSGLAPLIGYSTYLYGSGGVESTFDGCLTGTVECASLSQVPDDLKNNLLHLPRYGDDIYLTIDMNVQEAAARYYEASAIHSSDATNPCQHVNNPPGSVVVEDPNTGQILAMYSTPSYDPNKIVEADSKDTAVSAQGKAYWSFLQSNSAGQPLINRAAQGRYVSGSTFKAMTLIAGLDSGKFALSSQFSYDEATSFHVPSGETIPWVDYFNGTWKGILDKNSFPITLEQGFAYSDNTIFARLAYDTGADTWTQYAAKFGITLHSGDSPNVPFDAPYAQSTVAMNSSGQPVDLSNDLLAESGFGQGDLLITPLTMTEIVSTVAANGWLYEPHVGLMAAAVQASDKGSVEVDKSSFPDAVPFSGGPVIQSATATAMRHAMWSVVSYGTAYYSHHPGTGVRLVDTGTDIGGKTGTGQLSKGDPNAWFISLAPDDQAPGGGAAKYASTIMKEHGNEGACQVFVSNDLYLSLHV